MPKNPDILNNQQLFDPSLLVQGERQADIHKTVQLGTTPVAGTSEIDGVQQDFLKPYAGSGSLEIASEFIQADGSDGQNASEAAKRAVAAAYEAQAKLRKAEVPQVVVDDETLARRALFFQQRRSRR